MGVNEPTEAVAVRTGGLLAEFELVYRAEVGRVTAFFARRSRDPQTVADLTGDTFVAAMTSFAGFDPANGDEVAVRPALIPAGDTLLLNAEQDGGGLVLKLVLAHGQLPNCFGPTLADVAPGTAISEPSR